MQVSLIIPVYNEEDNLDELYGEIQELWKAYKKHTLLELIFVNDGSLDGSLKKLKELTKKDRKIKVVNFWRNYGQTAALSAGIDASRGDIILLMDADLQNDPNDIPKLIEKLEQGYEVASGWRKHRQDNSLTRTFPSRIANWLISLISRVSLHDFGCTLKAYRRDALEGVRLYGEMHRFIPVFASWQGARVAEVIVNHRPRIHGVSKYGLERTVKVFLDLILIAFMHKFLHRPMHAFGGIGVIGMVLSVATFIWAIIWKFEGVSFIESPLLIFSTTFFLFGATSILMGLLAEMLMRTYFESQNKHTYRVKEVLNGGGRSRKKA